MKSPYLVFISFAAVAAVVSACGLATKPSPPAPVVEAHLARAALVDMNGRFAGSAIFTESKAGVKIAIEARYLTPGAHGVHIHQGSECASSNSGGKVVIFGAAGSHFDPIVTRRHGRPDDSGIERSHAGDLPNLQVSLDGTGRAGMTDSRLTLEPGSRSVVGRTLVIHADRDDYVTNPSGNSGDRVLCGQIKIGA